MYTCVIRANTGVSRDLRTSADQSRGLSGHAKVGGSGSGVGDHAFLPRYSTDRTCPRPAQRASASRPAPCPLGVERNADRPVTGSLAERLLMAATASSPQRREADLDR